MASALKFRPNPCAHNLARRAEPRYAAAHSEHICIVVPPRHNRRVDIRTECRTDSINLVRCNRDADPRPAEGDAAVCLSCDDFSTYLLCNIGIIDCLLAERTDILYTDITELVEHHFDLFFELHRSVVTADDYIHGNALLFMLHILCYSSINR